MSKIPGLIFILALIVALSCSSDASRAEEIRKDIPDATWVPIFFKTIDEFTERGEIAPLREQRLDEDGIEARLWAGFGLQFLRGMIIRREGDQWRAFALETEIIEGTHERRTAIREVEPTRPWPELWEMLTDLGLLSLPDDSSLPDRARVLDGISYVVEYQVDGRYRTYKYGNPGRQSFPEAEKISLIVMLLDTEFGLSRYQAPGAFPGTVEVGRVALVRKEGAYGAFQVFDQQSPGEGRPRNTARMKWVYRDDGGSELYGDGVKTGEFTMEGWEPVEFGPFSVRWSPYTDNRGYVYYPDPKGEMIGQPERQFVAITNLHEIGELDAADEKWDYRAAFVDPPDSWKRDDQ